MLSYYKRGLSTLRVLLSFRKGIKMNYEHLRYILQIKEFGSISKAAAHNFVSQPYLSTILQNFEKDLGIKLFLRTKNGVAVAPEATDFFAKANKFLIDYDEFKHYSRTLTQSTFRLRIATVPFCYAEHAVNEMIKNDSSEKIEVRIGEYHSFDIAKEVMKGTFQIGFLSYNRFYKEFIENTSRYNDLEYVEVARLTPEIIISKNHPALEEIRKDNSKIRNYPAILQTVVSEDIVNIYDMFADTNIEIPTSNYIMTDHTTHMFFISESTGVTTTPHVNFYKDVLDKYDLVGIPIKELEDTISLGYIYNKSNELSPYIKELLEKWERILKNKLGKH